MYRIIGEYVAETAGNSLTNRAVNELSATQSVQLGTYEDASTVSESIVDSNLMQSVFRTTNMETFNLSNTLNREYPISNFVWNSGDAIGIIKNQIDFPQALFSRPYIADKIKDFRFFKGAMRITCRISANRFLYGKLIMWYAPMPLVSIPNDTSIFLQSGYPHVLISASANETAVFDIPFIYDKRALDLDSYAANELCYVKIGVFNPLTGIENTPVTAQVLVTAQFVDAQLFLPTSFVPQSETETFLKSTNDSIVSKFESATTKAASVFNATLGRPYAKALISSAASAMMAGLSKPTTTALTTVMKINPFSDLNYGKGIDTSLKFAMDPCNSISTKPIVGGISEDEMRISHIIGTPMLTKQLSFLQSNTASQTVVNLQLRNDSLTYLDQFSKLFRYYSGSQKIKLYITASLFHSVRFVIWLTDNTLAENWEDCYHKVVDVQGDTEVSFTVPYTSNLIASGNAIANGFGIRMKFITWSQVDPSTVPTPIYVNVYKAAASDFQFGVMSSVVFEVQSNPRMDFDSDFEPFHTSHTGYGHSGLLFGETYTTYREMIHRYLPYKSIAENTEYFAYEPAFAGYDAALTGYSRAFFAFWRGSTRFKISGRSLTTNTYAFLSDTNGYLVGNTITSTVNPVLEFEIPYYENNLFLSTTQDSRTIYSIRNAPTNLFVFNSAGDDYSLHFLRPCVFNIQTTPTVDTIGVGALLVYTP